MRLWRCCNAASPPLTARFRVHRCFPHHANTAIAIDALCNRKGPASPIKTLAIRTLYLSKQPFRRKQSGLTLGHRPAWNGPSQGHFCLLQSLSLGAKMSRLVDSARAWSIVMAPAPRINPVVLRASHLGRWIRTIGRLLRRLCCKDEARLVPLEASVRLPRMRAGS